MGPREIAALLAAIDCACDADPRRAQCRSAVETQAKQLAAALPWVHRTGRAMKSGPNATAPGTWRSILGQRMLTPSAAKPHEVADGRGQCVYFFVGTCAYPDGHVALVFRPDAEELLVRATFSPFDSGSLLGWAEPDQADPHGTAYLPWTDAQRCQFLQDHTGKAEALTNFAPVYLASHFNEAAEYVTRPRRSDPDFPAYHALRSLSGDRRAWTLEVPVHGETGVALDAENLLGVFVHGRDFFQSLPSELKALAHVVDEDDDQDSPVDPLAEACANWICRRGVDE